MERMTPQIAKLIVLNLSLASAEKYYEIVNDDAVPVDDRPIFRQAIDNYIVQLKENIRYQKGAARI